MNLVKAGDAVGGGEGVMGAIRPILPKAIADIYKAVDMVQTGEYRDTRGRKVVDVSGLTPSSSRLASSRIQWQSRVG